MRTVRLFQDHYEHKDGKVIRHRAGSVIELPDADAQHIARATIETRAATRELARTVRGTPESKHDL